MPKVINIEEAIQARKLGLTLKEYREGISRARLLSDELLTSILNIRSS